MREVRFGQVLAATQRLDRMIATARSRARSGRRLNQFSFV